MKKYIFFDLVMLAITIPFVLYFAINRCTINDANGQISIVILSVFQLLLHLCFSFGLLILPKWKKIIIAINVFFMTCLSLFLLVLFDLFDILFDSPLIMLLFVVIFNNLLWSFFFDKFEYEQKFKIRF